MVSVMNKYRIRFSNPAFKKLRCKQFEFPIKHTKTGQKDTVFCTAVSMRIAFLQVALRYKDWIVSPLPLKIRKAHAILTEIDASMCDERDTAAMMRVNAGI
jgi:hypothetical protein